MRDSSPQYELKCHCQCVCTSGSCTDMVGDSLGFHRPCESGELPGTAKLHHQLKVFQMPETLRLQEPDPTYPTDLPSFLQSR